MKRFLAIFVNFLLAATLLFPANVFAAPGTPGSGGPSLSPEQQVIAQAILDAINAHKSETLFYQIYKPKVEQININDTHNLAVAWVTPVDPVTSQNVPTEPSTVVAHLNADGLTWTVSLPTSPDYSAQVLALPDSLMGKAQRDMLGGAPSVEPQSTTILTGYYLPWLGGTGKYLSGSIWHYLPPGYMSCPKDCHFAYDFYGLSETGNDYYFRILASRSGIVSAYYDGWNNGNHGSGSNCDSFVNYIVLKDPTTNPVTYMLYYHLAQGTINPILKHVGAIVNTGDFLARADDTGCSSGSHVHFMVYSNPYSDHWGTSVDFAFNEVSINNGHPRKCIEAQTYPALGSQCMPSDYYVSGNRGATPPTGTLTAPAAWTVVNSSTVAVQGSGTDNEQVVGLQLAADYDGTWQAVGDPILPPADQVLKNYSFNVNLDLCAAGVPDGPLTLGLWVTDVDGTRTLNAQSPRPIIKNYTCQVPPPPCHPTLDQVALFSLPDYQGDCQIYAAGKYDTADLGDIADNTAASILVGAHVMATVFDNSGYNGRAETFDASDPGLEDNRIGVGAISSFKVASLAPPAAPILIVPHNITTSALNAADSFVLTWDANGGGVDFQVTLTNPDRTRVTSPWLRAKSWSVGSLPSGSYTWTVTGRNHAGQTVSAPGTFTIAATSLGGTAVSFPYGDNMASNINQWTPTGLWRQSTSNAAGEDASNVFWVANKSSGTSNPSEGTYDSSTIIGSDLTSPPISIPTGSAAYLRFREYVHTESPGPYWDQRLVQISVDAGPFTDLYQMQDDPTDWWVYSPFLNLSGYAGKNVRIRFHFDQVDAYNNATIGWRIDDVGLNATVPDVSQAEAKPNDTTAQATAIPMNSSVKAFICPAGDLDYYSFKVIDGETVNFNIDAQGLTPPSGLDTYIFLIDSDGHSVIAENDDEVAWVVRDSNLTYTFHRTGTYYLKVKSWSFPGSSYPTYACSSFFYTLGIYGSDFAPVVSLTTPTLPWIGSSATDITANIVASPGGLAIVDFLWHSPDWINDTWIKLNSAISTSSTGWKATLDPTGKTIPGSALVVRAIDRVGLSDSAWISNLQTDTTPPATQLTAAAADTRSTVIPLSWTASDAESGLRSQEIEYKDVTASDAWQLWNVTLPGTARQAFFPGTPGHTYAFNIHGIDNLGNVEPFPAAPEIQTTIAPTCAPDSFDGATSNDNSVSTAKPLALDTLQTHNFCPSGDQDWVSFTLPANGDYLVEVFPVSSGAAMNVNITSADGITVLLQKQSPALGVGLDFNFTAPAGKYRMQISALNANLWGTNMTYSVRLVSAGNSYWIYLPLLGK